MVFSIRTCIHEKFVWIFKHNFVADKSKNLAGLLPGKVVILIFNQHIDKIQSLPVTLLMVSLDNEQIVSQSLSTTF